MRRSLKRIALGLILLATSASYADHLCGQELPWVEGSTTIAVLPDTQYYTTKYPDNFQSQTKWIAENRENREKRNIAYVWHLGDITQDDTPAQWEVAKSCFDVIEGNVPYLLVPGNHDYSGDAVRSSRLSEYFPVDKMKHRPTFGGVFHEKKLDNNYHLFRIGDQDWIALGLECGPRQAVVEWANSVLDQHADRYAAVVTHAYLFRDNQRYDYTKGSQRASPHGFTGDGNDGEELWQKLIRKHKNVMVVISGHVRTGGPTGSYLASEGDHGNVVHQMMTCYQKLPRGGLGYMRVLEFLPDGETVQVRTFSPSKKTTRESELEDFTFELKSPRCN
ncbi:MAG: metallophosphoesterase [Planctomycetes bacterium]|nr:metallophosphoesterase [Planctomycetota bacterium]